MERLQFFKCDNISRRSGITYRFAVVDYSRSSSYPSNFVCMVTAKVEMVKGKAQALLEASLEKIVSFFVQRFKSIEGSKLQVNSQLFSVA